ncbi:hypothetical protein BG004_003567 [Podila humilis]|nr:hypothetical protein BG004_003567 [Podila humilis]
MLAKALFIVTLLAAVANAQPMNAPPRTSRAIALVGSDVYLYGGKSNNNNRSSPYGDCYSDLYSLNLDPTNGWKAGDVPWANIKLDLDNALNLGQTSWAVPSADGDSLFFYGQTLCPNQLAKDTAAPHPFTASSGSVTLAKDNGHWKQTETAVNVLGPRLVQADEPVPVQVLDSVNHVVYTFVYDANNPQLGMQLWTFSANHPSANIAQSAKNITMPTVQPSSPPPPPPPPPTNSTNTTEPIPPPPPLAPAPITLAPFVDVGAAVYLNGSIVVVGGGRTTGLLLKGDDVDAASGYYKMDRCWIYNIAANTWTVQNLTSAGGSLPLPRRLAALLVDGSKIHMHGGNTTQTVPTDGYSKELWTLDTLTWQWTQGVESPNGRSQHTLVSYNNQLLSFSGFEYLNSKSKGSKTALVMVYDPATASWSNQFGTIRQSFFQKNLVVILCGSIGGLLALLICSSVGARLWRKHRRANLSRASGVNRKRSKPFVTSTAIKPDSAEAAAAEATSSATAAAAASARLSGMTLSPASGLQGSNNGPFDNHMDLSALPRASESTVYGMPHQQQYQLQDQHSFHHQQGQKHEDPYQHHYNFNPFAPVNQQQQVPLMHANAMEQPEDLQAYTDDDDQFNREFPLRPDGEHDMHVGYAPPSREGSGVMPVRTEAPTNHPTSSHDLQGFP